MPTPTSTPEPLYGWTYEGEVRLGAVDATTFVLPDGTYRQFYNTWAQFPKGQEPTGSYQAVASSTDGLHWTEEGNASFSQFAYGRVVRLGDGRYRIYFGGGKAFGARTSTDGRTWAPEPAASLRAPEADCGDCGYGFGDVLILSDGSYRLVYEQRERTPQFPQSGVVYIVSASSKDGLIWQKDPGLRIDPVSGPEQSPIAAHPRVITLANGSYKMFYWTASKATWSATSRDGLTWTERKPENVFGSDPDILMLPDGRMRMFVNWRDDRLPGGPEVQKMWSYLWGPVPFLLSMPETIRVRQGQSGTATVQVSGIPGKAISFSATVFGNGVFESTDIAAPLKVELTPTSGTAPLTVRLNISVPSSTPFGPMSVVITGDDETTRVRTVVLVSVFR